MLWDYRGFPFCLSYSEAISYNKRNVAEADSLHQRNFRHRPLSGVLFIVTKAQKSTEFVPSRWLVIIQLQIKDKFVPLLTVNYEKMEVEQTPEASCISNILVYVYIWFI